MLAGLPLLGASSLLQTTPSVTVYAFALNGGSVEKDSGSKLAVIVANQMALLGGVNVTPGPVGTERKDYLAVARSEGADYYIAGYLTPLGDDVSVVEQVVSTITGVVVFSNTAQLRTYADAAGQGELLRSAIIRHSRRNLDAYIAPPPPAAVTPEPQPSQGTQTTIGKLFGRKKQATRPVAVATSTPRPEPTVTAPVPVPSAIVVTRSVATPSPVPAPHPAIHANAGVIGVLEVIGTAPSKRRSDAARALANALREHHRKPAIIASSTFRDAAAACAAAGNASAILGATLALHSKRGLGNVQTLATLQLTAYDCRGKIAYRQTFDRNARGDQKRTIDRVVGAAISAYLHTPLGARP